MLARPTPVVREDTPSALADTTDLRFPKPLVEPDLIRSGGPPPDGIPALDEPKFECVACVDWLADDGPVMALTVGREIRACPLHVMARHGIVDDTVPGAGGGDYRTQTRGRSGTSWVRRSLGPLAEERLAYRHRDTFGFAWVAFCPRTRSRGDDGTRAEGCVGERAHRRWECASLPWKATPATTME